MRAKMNRIQELESTIKISKKVLKNDKKELEELIYQEIKADMLQEFENWRDQVDKEMAHKYIIKALQHYVISEKQMLKLESKLIDVCIKQGVK